MSYNCIFFVNNRCTASVSHFFPDSKHIEKYCHSLDCNKCPIIVVYVTRPGVFSEGW